MKYQKAKAEVVMFDNSDVITTSGAPKNCDQPSKQDYCGGGSPKHDPVDAQTSGWMM